MQIDNVLHFHNELTSIGLNISGCDSSGGVQISFRPTCPEGEEATWVDPTDNLVALAIAAHEKELDSKEALALQASMPKESWVAYVDARNKPIIEQREQLYRNTTDKLFMEALEQSTPLFEVTEDAYVVKLDKKLWDKWVTAKTDVRTALPIATATIAAVKEP